MTIDLFYPLDVLGNLSHLGAMSENHDFDDHHNDDHNYDDHDYDMQFEPPWRDACGGVNFILCKVSFNRFGGIFNSYNHDYDDNPICAIIMLMIMITMAIL